MLLMYVPLQRMPDEGEPEDCFVALDAIEVPLVVHADDGPDVDVKLAVVRVEVGQRGGAQVRQAQEERGPRRRARLLTE